jgi:hypothetical protein
MTSSQMKEDELVQPIDKLQRAQAGEFAGREREWAENVDNALVEMAQGLSLHTTLAETPDGSLAKVDLTRPTSVRQVSELRRQHNELQEQTQSLRAQLHTAARAFQAPHASVTKVEALPEPAHVGTVPDFGSIRQAIGQLLATLQQHQQEETKLLLDSVNTDIGVGD